MMRTHRDPQWTRLYQPAEYSDTHFVYAGYYWCEKQIIRTISVVDYIDATKQLLAIDSLLSGILQFASALSVPVRRR
jgi:hypothetical protein